MISKWPFTFRARSGERTPLLRMLSASSSSLSSSNVLRGLVLDSTNSARGTLTYSCNDFTAFFVFISFLLFLVFLKFLVLFLQKNRGHGTVGFGDDEELRVSVGAIAAEEPETALNAEFIFSAVFFAHVAPLAANVAREKLLWRLSCFFESGQRAGCCDDLAE